MPEDFAELAASLGNAELAARYGISETTVKKFRRIVGIPAKRRATTRLAVPADFPQRAPGASNPDLCSHYGVCKQVIMRWRRECGIRGRPSGPKAAPMPEGFAEAARTMGVYTLARHFDLHPSKVQRMRSRLGIKGQVAPSKPPRRKKSNRPAPDDFAALAPTLSLLDAKRRFRAGIVTLKRWAETHGVAFRERPKAAPKVRSARKRKPIMRVVEKRAAVPVRPPQPIGASLPRDGSLEGRAAEFLRKERFLVWRCGDDRGRLDPKGKLWRVGMTVLTGEQLVAKARAKGWAPDEWERIAA